jgi:hypothetical protein
MHLWVMVIVMQFGVGYHNAMTSQTISGFESKEACLSQLEFVRDRNSTYDAYCISVK